MLIATVAAWTLCFGAKPVTCEAWQHVYTCDKYGCIEYGEGPLGPPPVEHDSTVMSSGPACAGTVILYRPDGSGILTLQLGEGCGSWPMPSNYNEIPQAIPRTDFKPVEEPK